MFLHLLPRDDSLYAVSVEDFAKRHYIKRFEKDYPGKRWAATFESIKQELSRIGLADSDLQRTQQVDELWHNNPIWIFKYDFRIAQSKQSAKNSGNRCVCLLNLDSKIIKILILFGKDDLPKNMGEQAFIETTLRREHFLNTTMLSS